MKPKDMKKFVKNMRETGSGEMEEIYIEKKDKSKFLITSDNLKNSECDINLTLKGIWINNDINSYGLLWEATDIKVNKFNG